MEKLTSSQIRQRFFDYFVNKQHHLVPSSSLIPANDPTLLFVNAGMVQFKDVFLGAEQRAYTRATSSQRCVRAGGKHNDLENVGFTARHHTFFEMLGNFSFGDYFKREAIQFAWEFLTKELGLPEEKLWVTVYKDDKEAEKIWLEEMQVDSERFSRCGEKDNFWAMGDTGPCGPCTEIFYDHGSEIAGGPPGSPDEDGDRYVEIWNLVFMEYERQASGELKPLPKPSVDTGMGLERIAAVVQGVHSNYDIDLFQHLIKSVAAIAQLDDLSSSSLKVIADHIRSCSFLIADGVRPSNEGRGYVLRRIMRRAIRHGNKLGIDEAFFFKLVEPLIEQMGAAYPELANQQMLIEDVILREEEQFAQTLEKGLQILEQAIAELTDKVISGEVVFKLYDTYGFPVDLTADIARERGLTIDEAGFERCMQAQRKRSQQGSQFAVDYTKSIMLDVVSQFTGYDTLIDEGCVRALLQGEEEVKALVAGQTGAVVLDKTPFYAESGGQVGDKGELLIGDKVVFQVTDVQKAGEAILHLGEVVEGELKVDEKVLAEVNPALRHAARLNHSATHLLHAALHRIVGAHVIQKGSLVDANRLRFDFSHAEPVSIDQLRQLESLVNEKIRANYEVQTTLSTLAEAKEQGVMALFGEKYGDEVRVLSMGEFSKELCGGTHVIRTGDIGLFKILSETGIAAGVRRIEAVTGQAAIDLLMQIEAELGHAATMLKTSPVKLTDRIAGLQKQLKALEKEKQQLQLKLASGGSTGQGSFAEQAKEVQGIKVLAQRLDGIDTNGLRVTMDHLKDQLGSAVILLASIKEDNKIQLVAGVTKNLLKEFKAGELVNYVAQQVGGKGGGRPDFAQAGGSDIAGLDKALDSVHDWVAEHKVKV